VADPLDLIERLESRGRNVPNYKYGPGFTASGYYQMINPTWRRWAKDAGVDISQYPTAMSAPKDVQRAVAEHGFKTEGFKPWEATKHLVGQEDKYRGDKQVVAESTPQSPRRPNGAPGPDSTSLPPRRPDGAPGPVNADIPTLPQNVDKGVLSSLYSPFEKIAEQQKETQRTLDETQKAAMAQLNQPAPVMAAPPPQPPPVPQPSAPDANFAALMLPRIRRGLLADTMNYGLLS
jgi:hypothetical protein